MSKQIKKGDKVRVLPYDGSHLCPAIDYAIKTKESIKVKAFHEEGTNDHFSSSVVILTIGGKDRVFGLYGVELV